MDKTSAAMRKKIGFLLFTFVITCWVAGQAFTEGFDSLPALSASGWIFTDNSTSSLNNTGWIQGIIVQGNYIAQSGPQKSYAYSYCNISGSTGSSISNWMILPARTLTNGDVITFNTRTRLATNDDLEVRISTLGNNANTGGTPTSVGVFSRLLLAVNPSETVGGFPVEWTRYTVTVSGLSAPVSGRIALRQVVINANGSPHPHTLGIDSLAYRTNCTAYAARVYVDSSRTTSGNGNSWNTAFKTVAEAFHAADSCTNVSEVWVKKGTYFPTSGTNRAISFTIPRSGIKLYGGFAGTETTIADRDMQANPTYLDADIGTKDTSSIIFNWAIPPPVVSNPGRRDNSYHVLVIANLGADGDSILIDGFVIRNGYANARPRDITYNPEYIDSSKGAGLYITNLKDIKIKISNCIIQNNKTTSYGGGMLINGAAPELVNCIVAYNTADSGGAVYNMGEMEAINCIFAVNNAASVAGGIINNGRNGYGQADLTNCTFTRNTGGSNGSIASTFYGRSIITNSILWGNTAPEIGNLDNPTYTSAAISYSIVQGGYPGTGNLNTNPAFSNPLLPPGSDLIFGTPDDGLRVSTGSPAVNSGNNSAVPVNTTTDITGTARIQGGTVDRGAYEGIAGILTTWTGAVSTNWQVAGNWTNGVPDSTRNAVVVLTANQPVLTADARCLNLTLKANTRLTAGTYKLYIGGN